MYRLNNEFVFSPSDITNAVSCEFAVLRALDVRLGRIAAPVLQPDAMLARTASLGDDHEARVLAELIEQFGEYDAKTGTGVYTVARPERGVAGSVEHAAAQTLSILRSGADVVFQAAFLRDRFNGFADFLIRQRDGAYAVYDTKLARHAKVSALLQVAAYGVELMAHDIPVAPQVYLILGDRSVSSHDLADIVGVYRERRARLESIVDDHVASATAVVWNDSQVMACGRCDSCAAEVEAHRDLLLVAGMRSSQRTRLIEAGVQTIDQLATRHEPVAGLRERSLHSLRAQAGLQIRQRPPGSTTVHPVLADIFEPTALGVLPVPDPGDVFFDFEGDPLWSDGDPSITGLEYLFGVVEVDTGLPVFRPLWAHNRAEEKQALIDFLDYVVERRTQFPGMHIYHYAAYEKSALLRLAGRYGVGEAIVDALLADGVLIDLYSVVRNAVRVSQPSYSLKKLEPLYMGAELRGGDVVNAGDSIVAYAAYCDELRAGNAHAAAEQLEEIAEYNCYDCRSTWRLRDWLCAQARARGIKLSSALAGAAEPPADDEDAALVERLQHHAGEKGTGRSAEQQALALLAASIGYHRRELKPFWWAHFDRLLQPASEWAETGDVLLVESAEVVSGWSRTGKQRTDRRVLRLCGSLGAGSRFEPGQAVMALYDPADCPDCFERNPGARGVSKSVTVLSHRINDAGRDEVEVEERLKNGAGAYPTFPMALVPGDPIRSVNQHAAIVAVATAVADDLDAGRPMADVLSEQACLALLGRQPPRLLGGRELPTVLSNDYVAALTEAVRNLDNSYLAVQGPPGSGKTYVAAHVIAALVKQGWKIGVVAQSHKVIENVLHAVAGAGVKPVDVAKKSAEPDDSWTLLNKDPDFRNFLEDHDGTGCVIGGTAWDFTNRNRIPPNVLDLLVIDEAGQFCLANTIAVAGAAARLLLLGDPQQLPQVSQGTHPESCEESALSWVIQDRRVMPAGCGYFLALTWRMHPALTAKVSALAYDGALKSNAEVTASRLLEGVEPGLHVRQVEHIGNSVESRQEADEVLAVVTDLIGRSWQDQGSDPRALAAADILVVAPFNAQVAKIRHCLYRAGIAGVQVGSVDRFQGQEAAVVIVSMTASAPEDVPRGMDFLLSRNRVNVAISRGKWCAIVIRSPRLTDFLPSRPAGLSQLGAFISLCS